MKFEMKFSVVLGIVCFLFLIGINVLNFWLNRQITKTPAPANIATPASSVGKSGSLKNNTPPLPKGFRYDPLAPMVKQKPKSEPIPAAPSPEKESEKEIYEIAPNSKILLQ